MDTNSKAYKLKENLFVCRIRDYLHAFETVNSEENKLKIASEMFDYIVINKDIIDNDKNISFRNVIADKLEEFSGKKYFDADKYKKLLFPDDNNIVLCVPEPAQTHIVLPKLDEQIIPPPRVIFDDCTTNKITQVKCVGNENMLDQIMGYIAEKYLLSDRAKILSMVNESKTVDKIKVDQQYPTGPFLIKVNDHTYELYEKVTENIVNKGYIYNSTKLTTTINKVGKFGEVF